MGRRECGVGSGVSGIEEVRYDAVLFDLLSALLDSWSLWNDIAGGAEAGRKWRAEYLRITYGTGAYRPYEDLVAEAAEAVGLGRGLAGVLADRYGELAPWPEAQEVLQGVAAAGVPLGVVTNCSERLGRIAVERLGVDFAVVVTAERAGYYKPEAQPYRLALEELGIGAGRCLFVAGSPFDLAGAADVGMPVYWHDRAGLQMAERCPEPVHRAPTLRKLIQVGNFSQVSSV